MEYAVFQLGNKQYKGGVGDIITVDKLFTQDGMVTFDKVLLVVNGDSVKIGTPTLPTAKVIGKIEGEIKGDKIFVSHYKSKVRHRKTVGFRAQFTRVQIEKIASR